MCQLQLISCLIMIFLCVVTCRRDDRLVSRYGKQNIDTENLRMTKIYGDQEHLRERVKACGDFFNRLAVLHRENNTITSLMGTLETCERAIVIIYYALEDTSQSYANQHSDGRIPASSIQLYLSRFAMSRVKNTHFEIKGTSVFDTNDFGRSTSDLVKRRSEWKYRRENLCEAKVCESQNLGPMCSSRKVEPHAALICDMCYPTKKTELINAHCQSKWKRERRAFYIVSSVLIALTLSSGLFLYVRRRYIRTKNPPQDDLQENGPVEQINPPGELYYYDGSRIDGMELTEHGPFPALEGFPDSHQRDGSKIYTRNPWNDSECDTITTTVAQRRLKQLGLFSRTGRKKVHGLFDFGAMQSKYDAPKSDKGESCETEKIPVIPWAPNATVRRVSDRETQRARVRTVSKGTPAAEPRNGSKAENLV